MAVDEVLLDGVANGAAPTLRFYGWLPPCLSLGYFQRFEVVDSNACRTMGIDVVRRPTGGRAILHDAELTYSLALPVSVLGQDRGILPSYHRISRALQAGLDALGVRTTMAPESAAPVAAEHGPICFDRPSAHEILLDGRKLVGSAQVRRGNAILQHGSILIEPRLERLLACLRRSPIDPPATPEALQASVVGLAELGIRDRNRLAAAIASAVEREFLGRLVPGGLSQAENEAVEGLATDKYRSSGWTERQIEGLASDTTRTR
jgi:lipoate-protein ligase A